MASPDTSIDHAAGPIPRRLFAYSGGFLTQRRLRRILQLSGHEIRLGRPAPGDGVVVWGDSPTSGRGGAVARARGVPLVTVEDAFLRSVKPGRLGDAPLGLLIDAVGLHFDARRPSGLEEILRSADLQDSNLLQRADEGIRRLKYHHLSKYNLHDPELPVPPAGFVLVVDQAVRDASVRASGADRNTFLAMLAQARADHPHARIVIKAHPEAALGLRGGHFVAGDCDANTVLLTDPVSPWSVLEAASAVYTLSSQLGFEAILAGHTPHVLGQPFYAGWGLTHDTGPVPRRQRHLTPAQLFAGAMILAPTWYDPCRDRLCSFEDAVDQLEAETRVWRQDRNGHVAIGMRAWKRRHLQSAFGRHRALRFCNDPAQAVSLARASGRGLLIWGRADHPTPGDVPVLHVEDAFLRSRGLGAELVPPLGLVADDTGIYFDPGAPSRLESLMTAPLPPGGAARADRLIKAVVAEGISKYNAGKRSIPALPEGHIILIPGQVEDDASVMLGTGTIRSNLELLRAARAANPDAVLIYKPHPDVEAGLRPGAVAESAVKGLADFCLADTNAAALLPHVDEVWTLTSTLGFEALLRGKAVTCLGAPFYAGWGLTRDLGPVPQRRSHAPDGSPLPRPDLAHLVHAALISYPRYTDPVSNLPCPPEVAPERLAHGPDPRIGFAHRALAKLQGRLAGYAWLWR